jgi:hypothetical protein
MCKLELSLILYTLKILSKIDTDFGIKGEYRNIKECCGQDLNSGEDKV